MRAACLDLVKLEPRELHASAGASLGLHKSADALPSSPLALHSASGVICLSKSRSYDSAKHLLGLCLAAFSRLERLPTPSPREQPSKTNKPTYGSYPGPLFSYAASAARKTPSVKPSFNRRVATSFDWSG